MTVQLLQKHESSNAQARRGATRGYFSTKLRPVKQIFSATLVFHWDKQSPELLFGVGEEETKVVVRVQRVVPLEIECRTQILSFSIRHANTKPKHSIVFIHISRSIDLSIRQNSRW